MAQQLPGSPTSPKPSADDGTLKLGVSAASLPVANYLTIEPSPQRWAWAEVDPTAIAHNMGLLRAAADGAAVWAVVKANAYGHGVVTVAQAALSAGAAGLCVALVQEAVELRRAGIGAPLLILTEQPVEQFPAAIATAAELTVYNPATIDALAVAARRAGATVDVHVHINTGMNRVGVAVDDALDVMRLVDALPSLRRVGTMTHFACADEPESPATGEQLAAFRAVLDAATEAGLELGRVHAANSAATLAVPDARFDMVRCGIALYGISPGDGVDDRAAELQPALSIIARVSHVARVPAGQHVSYGWRYQTERPTTLATVPLGYADGVPRALGSDRTGAAGFPVLIGGRRHPIAGVVTMDQLILDVGDAAVEIGDEVVLIGQQSTDAIRAEEWAQRLDTIGYEIVCGIGDRLPRIILDSTDVAARRPQP